MLIQLDLRMSCFVETFHNPQQRLMSPKNIIFSIATLCAIALHGQNAGAPELPANTRTPTLPPSIEQSKVQSPDQMPIKEVSPGIYELANVRLDQSKRSITFPANINMHEGPIEYFLVTSYGKVHESVLKMDVVPFHIHVCSVLLGSKGADYEALNKRFSQLKDNEIVPDSELDKMLEEGLFGQPVEMTIAWELEGKKHQLAAESLLVSNEDDQQMPPGQWFYTGSRVVNGIFSAGQSGDAVTVIGDYGSMINYIGPGFKNDELWKANIEVLPPIYHPVTVTFSFPGPDKQKEDSK